MRGERSEDEMANGVKGYVVRGKDRLGKPAWCYDGFFRVVSAAQGGWPAPPREYPSLSIAGGGVAAMLANGCTAVTIFAVATDGTETPLPSYEAALEDLAGAKASAEQACALLDKATSYIIRMSNEIERLRAESVAAKTALLDAREHRRREKDQSLNFMRERDDARAEIERLRDDAPLAADPQVFRYATARASEAERVNWILQGLAEQVTAAATDVDLPAPLREAIDALSKAARHEPVPPQITRTIPVKDPEHVGQIGLDLLTCALCWEPGARLVGNLTAAQLADAGVAAMVASGLTADEAHLTRIRASEVLLRDAQEALFAAGFPAEDGEPIAEQVRTLAQAHDAEREDTKRLRAEIAHLKAHAATLPIGLAPVPPGDMRPAVMGGECSACLAAPPYHEDTCKRRTAPHDLTPSQVAVAKVLDAWETWPGKVLEEDRPIEQALLMQLGDALRALRFVEIGNECLTDEGHALLARARKAGVLGVSTTERAAWARLVLALLLDARAVRAAESEKWAHLAKEWSERADAEAAAARQALRDLGVDVDALLSAEEGR